LLFQDVKELFLLPAWAVLIFRSQITHLQINAITL
jgi:hypothetical protein